jgi:hypothetical protein
MASHTTSIRYYLIILPYYVLQESLSLRVFVENFEYAFLVSLCVLYILPTPSFFIWLSYLVGNANYQVPHYVVFSIFLLLPRSSVQMFSSSRCPQHPQSMYVLPWGWEIKSHISLYKIKGNITVLYILIIRFLVGRRVKMLNWMATA